MKSFITTLVAAISLFWLPPSHANDSQMKAKADSVSLFQVPLQCPAAPEIACGSRAKPILLELERDPNISEAWINRAGSVLAVVGSRNSSHESRAKTVESLLEDIFEKKVATEIVGEAREKELINFLSGDGWYRGVQADNLSREEADIIAARLVRRIQARVALPEPKAKTLEKGFAEVFKRQFIRDPGQPRPVSQKPDSVREKQRNEDLLKVAREHLDGAEVTAFQEVIARGHRPEPGEK
ncbi:MAG: hypothetical protein AB7V13_27490 [Pseudorhodoplanes sp.]